jgi:hypothetical protein
MQTRPHRVIGDLAGSRYLVIAQPAGLTHEEHVSIQRRKTFECLAKRGAELLRGWRRSIHQLDNGPASMVSNMVEGEVPRNSEDPSTARCTPIARDRTACDPQKNFLRELARLAISDDPAQVAENSVSMRREQDVGVCHQATLPLKHTARGQTSRAETTLEKNHLAAIGS